jgi:heterodisulfide reductase subunit B
LVHIAKAQAYTSKVLKAKKKTEGVLIGMTVGDELGSSWSRPETVNKTVNSLVKWTI